MHPAVEWILTAITVVLVLIAKVIAWLIIGLYTLGTFLWRYLNEFAVYIFDPDRADYLAIEPLVTLNAVGIALSLFALEQKVGVRVAHSKEEGKRSKYMNRGLDNVVIAGFLQMTSILCILAERPQTSELGPEPNVYLWVATTATITGMWIVTVASMLAWLDLVGLGRTPSTNMPSINRAQS